jgi:hypothetical protein
VKHGIQEGQLLQQWGNGGRDGRLLQHWENMVTRMASWVSVLGKRAGGECQEVQHWRNAVEGKAISFSNGKTWWRGWAAASALVKYDGSDETVTSALVKHDRRSSQLIQQ